MPARVLCGEQHARGGADFAVQHEGRVGEGAERPRRESAEDRGHAAGLRGLRPEQERAALPLTRQRAGEPQQEQRVEGNAVWPGQKVYCFCPKKINPNSRENSYPWRSSN